MASSLVESQSATANNSSLVFPALTGVPLAAATDDVAVAFCFGKSSTGTWTPPAGWTTLAGEIRPAIGLSYKIAARRWSAGYTPPTFAWAGGGTNQTCVGFIFVIRGVPTSIAIADLIGTSSYAEFAAGPDAILAITQNLVLTSEPKDTLLAAFWQADDTNMNSGSWNGNIAHVNNTNRDWFTTAYAVLASSTSGTDAAAIGNLVVGHSANLTQWWVGGGVWGAATAAFGIKIRREAAALESATASLAVTATGDLTTDPLGNLGTAPANLAVTGSGYLVTGPGLGAIGTMRGAAIYAHAFGAPPPPYTVTFGSVVEDDMMVVIVDVFSTTNNATYFVQTPAGWSTDGPAMIFGNRENWEKVRVFYRRATASDSGYVFSASPSFDQPSFTGYKLLAFSIQGIDWNRGAALQNQTMWGDAASPYEYRLAPNTKPSMQLMAHAWQQNGTSNGSTFGAGGGYVIAAQNSDNDSTWTGGIQFLRQTDTGDDRAVYSVPASSASTGRGANWTGTFSIKAADYGQFFSEGQAQLLVTAVGALTTAVFGGEASLTITATGTLTSDAALFIALESSSAVLTINASGTTLLNPTPAFHVAGVACQYRMEGVGQLSTGQTLEVFVNGLASPCSALTVRSGEALGQVCTATLHADVVVGSGLIVNLRYMFPDGTSAAEVFTGTVTSVNGDARRASVTAVGVFAARLPTRPEVPALMFASNSRVRLGADFFARPGDLYEITSIKQVVTSCQARGQWFSEFELL